MRSFFCSFQSILGAPLLFYPILKMSLLLNLISKKDGEEKMRVNMKAMAKAMDKARLSSVISLERTMDSLSHEINKENTKKYKFFY